MTDLRIYNPENAIYKDPFSQMGVIKKNELDKGKTKTEIEVIIPNNACFQNFILRYLKNKLSDKNFYIKFNKKSKNNLNKNLTNKESIVICKILKIY